MDAKPAAGGGPATERTGLVAAQSPRGGVHGSVAGADGVAATGQGPLLPPVPSVDDTQPTWRKRLDMTVAVLGASMVALLSGTPNAFNTISHKLEADLHESDAFISFLTGLGVAGLQMSLPAGILADTFDTTVACLCSAAVVVAGYVGMSLCTNSIVLVLCYAAVGVGSGCTYLSALQTAINLGYALGIGLVSLCMSLSLSVTIAITNGFASTEDCYRDSCWRDYVRTYGAACALAMYLGSLGLVVANRYNGPQDSTAFDRPRKISLDLDMPLYKTLRIFRKPFFLACFFGNLMGVGGGTLIIGTCRQMWRNFNSDPAEADYNQTIMVIFSIFTGVGNVVSPVVADMFHRRGTMKRSTFVAFVLLAEAVIFAVLGLITSVFAIRDGGNGVRLVFMGFMAAVGFGFGTCLSTYPAILADNFGFRNFGSFMSFLQLGAACTAILGPVVASWVVDWTGYYSPMHWAYCVLIAVAALLMFLVPSRTLTFHPADDEPSKKTFTSRSGRAAYRHMPEDDEDDALASSHSGGGGGGGSGDDFGRRSSPLPASPQRDAISLPRATPAKPPRNASTEV